MEESYADISFLEETSWINHVSYQKEQFFILHANWVLQKSKEKYYLMMALGLRWVKR